MKRFFASDAESDMLIAEATKTFGLKIGDIINMAIKNQFLPITEPFRTEARFILQRHTEGALEAQEIKQSMTRGIRALGTRPVRDADRLQGFFARYHLHEDVENCTITENDALWESAVEVYNISLIRSSCACNSCFFQSVRSTFSCCRASAISASDLPR